MSIRSFCSTAVNFIFYKIASASQFLLVLGSCLILALLVIAGHPLMGLLVYSTLAAGTCLYAQKHGGISFWQFVMGGFMAGVIEAYLGVAPAMGYTISIIQFIAIPVIMIMYTLGAVLLSLNWKKLFEKAQAQAAAV